MEVFTGFPAVNASMIKGMSKMVSPVMLDE